MKICNECKWCKRSPFKYNQCTHPSSSGTNVVTGERHYEDCYDVRDSSLEKRCGFEGRFFEKKPSLLSAVRANILAFIAYINI